MFPMEVAITAELIAALYEAALDPVGLSALTEFIAQVLCVDSAGIWLNENGQIKELSVTADIAESEKPYLDYYHRLDVWQSGDISKQNKSGIDKVTIGSELISDQALHKTEFFNDFAKQYSMTNPMGSAIGLSSTATALVSTNRQNPRFRLTEADKLPLQALLPHLKSALQLRMRLKLSSQIMPQFFALETLAFGTVICDRDSRVVFANSSAERLIRQRGTVGFRQKDRALVATGPIETSKLSALIHAAATTGLSGSIVLADGKGVAQTIALVTPLPTSVADQVGPEHAMVALRQLDGAPAFDASRLAQLFKLSPAQAALAIALYEGKSFDDIAIARNVKVSTLRTHFAEVLNRTGAKGLRDLTRLLGMIPPLR